jgi:uncharacterized protein YbjT (DUF2867 family)
MMTPVRIALVGATGLIGQEILRLAVGRDDLRIVGIARREVPLPPGARMEVFVAEPDKWGDALAAAQPDALICSLGTTMAKAGGDKEAFRAVDRDLVIATAEAALACGVRRMVAVSSAGAEAYSKNFYLQVKGETEAKLSKLDFLRLDILRPGLLRGQRDIDRRTGERLAIMASPITDLFLHGRMRSFRSIPANKVAAGALALAMRKTRGRYVHDNEGIYRAANTLSVPVQAE